MKAKMKITEKQNLILAQVEEKDSAIGPGVSNPENECAYLVIHILVES